MGWPEEPLILPKELQDGILQGKFVAFIGAGISTDYYGDWVTLINNLCEYCGCSKRVTKDSSATQKLEAADGAKQANLSRYLTHLGNHFGRYPTGTHFLYPALMDLPFKDYMTVNYDPLLERASKNHNLPANLKCNPDIKAYPDLNIRERQHRTIFYLHGKVDVGKTPKNRSIVLSQSEFTYAYRDNGPIKLTILPCLPVDNFCYFGCELSEPDMRNLFNIEADLLEERNSSGRGNSSRSQKYIFFSKPEVTTEDGFDELLSRKRMTNMEEEYRKLRIKIIWYVNHDGNHSSLLKAFEDLAELYYKQSNPNPLRGI